MLQTAQNVTQATTRKARARAIRPAAMKTLATLAGFAAVSAAFGTRPVQAATIDWDGDTSATWATGGNWAGGTAPANDSTTDIARFNLASAPAFQPTATSAGSVNGLIFGDGTITTAALTLTTSTAANRLNIGAGGIVMNANAGPAIVGNAGTQGVRVAADQGWTNNSSNLLTVSSFTNVGTTSNYTVTLNGSGNISTHTAGTITDNGAGKIGLIVDLGGTFTSSNAAGNNYTGGLTIKRGMVSGGGATSFGGSGGLISLGDTTLSNNNNATLAQTGAVTVANAITVNSGSSGTLKITANVASTFSGAVTLNNALTVEQTTPSNTRLTTLSGQISGNSTITVLTTTPATNTRGVALTGANSSSFSGNIIVNSGVLNFANGSLGSAAGAGSLQMGNNTYLQWATGNTQDISNKTLNPSGNAVFLDLQTNNVAFGTTNGLTGSSGSISKTNSAGILTLNAANDFSGNFNTGTTAGGVVIGQTNALQNASVGVGGAGGLSFASGVTSATIGNLASGSLGFSLTNAGSGAVALTIGSNGLNSTMGSNAVISGTGSITQNGAGIWGFTTTTPINTFSGGVNLLAGSLDYRGGANPGSDVQAGGGSLVGGTWGTGTVTLGNGTATDVTLASTTGSGSRFYANNVVFAGDVTVGGAGTQAIVFNMFTDGSTISLGDALTTPNKITLTRTNELTTNNPMQFWGEVEQSGGTYGITKLGSSTLTLGGGENVANTFAGPVTINAGTVTLGKAANTAAIVGNVIINGGTLNTGVNAQQINDASTITMSSGTLTVGNSETIAGLSVAAGAGTGSGTLTIASGGSASISNSTFTYNLTTAGNGVTLGDAVASSGTVVLNGDLGYTGTTNASQLATVDLGAGTRTFTVNNGAAVNDLTVTGVISDGSLIKAGGGAMRVNNISPTVGVTVNGGVFGGTGGVGAITLNSGGTLSPGASIESLASNTNTWNGGGAFELELSTDGSTGAAGTDWDLLTITGGLDLSGASTSNKVTMKLFTMADANTAGLLGTWDQTVDHTWAGFVTTTTGITGFDAGKFAFDTSGFQNTFGAGGRGFSVALNGNNLDLVYTVVPEPASLSLLALGAMAGLRRRRAV